MTVPTHATRAQLVLRLLAGFGAVRRDQVEALLLGDSRMTPGSRRVATHRVVAELRDRGLAAPIVVPGPAGTVVRGLVLTPAGHRVYAAVDGSYPRRRNALSIGFVDHAVALVDIALAFRDDAVRAGNVALLWEADWEATSRIGALAVIPDGLVTLERDGWRTRAFIEADRSTERHQAFGRKVQRYVSLYRSDTWRRSMKTWPLILTVTMSDSHAQTLARLAHRVATAEGGSPIARAFRFTSYDALRANGPLGPVWYAGVGADRLAPLDDPRTALHRAPDAASDIVVRPDARSPERKGTELNLENFKAHVHGP